MSDYKNWHIETDENNIAWCHIDKANSKVNLLSGDVIAEFSAVLDAFAATPPQGIIIVSDKHDSFIFGADIKEFTTLNDIADARAFLQRGHDLMNKLAAMPCPTVSMVHGICLGGGTELSLACDYFVASTENVTKIGLPEIKLGIHPGYGGTQRSLQRCGPVPALDMMLTGRMLTARNAKKIGLVDEIVPLRQLKQAAIHFVMRAPKRKKPPLLQRVLSHSMIRPLLASQMRKQVAKKALQEHYPAPYALINLWKRYADQPKKMLAEEINTVAELAVTPTARNLVRVFFLQEQLKGLGKQIKYQPRRVHVIGGGIMGGDIASWCAIQGYRVTVQDQDPERLAVTFKRAQESFKKKFKRDRRAIRDANDRLIMDHRGDGITTADLVIEAIFEDAEVKRKLYQSIEPKMKTDAILATNTSSIMLEDLTSALNTPGRLVGLHFFNPVALMPLVEVIHGKQTDPEVMQKALAFTRAIGKLPLPTRSSPGFLVNRILMPYLMEAVIMVTEGIPAEAIDKAAVNYGMPMGPIELADTVGLDICRNVAVILANTLGLALPADLNHMVEEGHLGKKSGRGFYTWSKGKAIKNKKAQYGNMQEIQDRLVFRLLNEALSCWRENIVEGEDQIDAGVIFGTGFAPFRGGPLRHIRDEGQSNLHRKLIELEKHFGERFRADEAWNSLAAE